MENITNDENLEGINTEEEGSLEDFFKELEDPKNQLANNQAKRDINYSAALREKNQKIQEEKNKVASLEKQIAVLTKENGDMLGVDDDDPVQKKLQILQDKLDAAEKRSLDRDKIATEQKERALLDETIKSLKEKYKNSALPFDEGRVLAEVLKKNKENATPRDLEEVQKLLLLDKMVKDRHKEGGITEGGSTIKVDPATLGHLDADATIEKWLKGQK